jgi:DNA-binding NarL/FixJ family response regulator
MSAAAVNVRTCGVDDEQLLARFKERAPALRMVLYNGGADRRVQRHLRRLGADSYLSRSSDLEATVRAVERVCQAGS